MAAVTEALLTPFHPTDEDVDLAQRSASELSRLPGGNEALNVTVSRGRRVARVTIPAVAFHLLEMILEEMAQGHSVALTPIDREVSTQKAADLLNVSRPHLVKLLESGKIPFRRVGTHRRVRTGDLLQYKMRMDADADRAFAELVAQAQELGMGYE